MRKFTGLAATAIAVLAFGLGHAGCYTSGIPGGAGAGGATASTGGTSASNGGNESDASQDDAGEAATPPCTENGDCDGVDGNKHFCLQSTGTCVACLEDSDCNELTDAGIVATPSQHYCLHNACEAFTACDYPGKCAGDAGLCNQSLQRCVQCLTTADCTSGTTCSGTVCRQACASANTCPDKSPVCLAINTSTGSSTGICTERCAAASDCLPGYACIAQACTPTD